MNGPIKKAKLPWMNMKRPYLFNKINATNQLDVLFVKIKKIPMLNSYPDENLSCGKCSPKTSAKGTCNQVRIKPITAVMIAIPMKS